jgi:hypothetical protein
MKADEEGMLAKMETNKERMEGEVEANSENFEVLRENMWTSQDGRKTRIDALISRVDAWLDVAKTMDLGAIFCTISCSTNRMKQLDHSSPFSAEEAYVHSMMPN